MNATLGPHAAVSMTRWRVAAAMLVLGMISFTPSLGVYAQDTPNAPSATQEATPGSPGSPASPGTAAPASEPISPGAPMSAGAAPDEMPGAVASAHLPRDLSPWAMYEQADIVVKAVMIGLAFASIVTWTVWLAKTVELMSARRRLRKALAAINDERSLTGAALRVGNRRSIAQAFIAAAVHELRLSAGLNERAGIKERIALRLGRIEAAAARSMNRGTGVLATIGSTAPFVGLFGTVWGIMNSFIGISKAQTTNLAVVAPGIAEALLATALGLFAAIPAVIIYNQFARSMGTYKGLLGDASAEVLRLVSRDLDSGNAGFDLARAAE